MCCFFTVISWTIDALAKLWTFVMSCAILTSVCSLLFFGSIAGIALGYNYSLSEYIHLLDGTKTMVYFRGSAQADEVESKLHEDSLEQQNLKLRGIAENNMAPPMYEEITDKTSKVNFITAGFRGNSKISTVKAWSMDRDTLLQNYVNKVKGLDLKQAFKITSKEALLPATQGSVKKIVTSSDDDGQVRKNLNQARQLEQESVQQTVKSFVEPSGGDQINWYVPKVPPKVQVVNAPVSSIYLLDEPTSTTTVLPEVVTQATSATTTAKLPIITSTAPPQSSSSEIVTVFIPDYYNDIPGGPMKSLSPSEYELKKAEKDYEYSELRGLPVRRKRKANAFFVIKNFLHKIKTAKFID